MAQSRSSSPRPKPQTRKGPGKAPAQRTNSLGEIVVVGGGMVGAASAVRLQQAGAQVTLVDAGDEQGRASFGNAGHLVIDAAEPLASWSNVLSAPSRLFAFGGPLDFCPRDIDLWLPWSFRYLAACRPERFRAGTAALGSLLERALPAWRGLVAGIGRQDLLEERGHFQLWESEASAREGLQRLARADLGPAHCRPITNAEAERLNVVFHDRVKGGVFFENTAKLADPGAAVRALWQGLEAAGGRTVIGKAMRLRTEPGRARVTLEDGCEIEAAQVLVAAGARSANLMAGLGARTPLIAERGYHVQFAEHAWPQDLTTVFFEDRWVYVAPFLSGLRATSFTELGRPDTAPDPRKWAALERHVRELGLPVRGQPTRWRGSRPTLPDFLPAIGRLSPEAIYAFGHQHIGITLSAATAEAVVEMVETKGSPDRLAPFNIARFR
jgi:D-amino-acid dehydrogenase